MKYKVEVVSQIAVLHVEAADEDEARRIAIEAWGEADAGWDYVFTGDDPDDYEIYEEEEVEDE